MIIHIVGLAFQAMNAFVGVDLTGRMDRLYGASFAANLAFMATLVAASQPIEHA